MSKDDKSVRDTPPDGPDDFRHLWSGLDKAHKSWAITGPVHAAFTNWKAWAIGVGAIAWVKGDDILPIIQRFLEVGQ